MPTDPNKEQIYKCKFCDWIGPTYYEGDELAPGNPMSRERTIEFWQDIAVLHMLLKHPAEYRSVTGNHPEPALRAYEEKWSYTIKTLKEEAVSLEFREYMDKQEEEARDNA